MDPIHKGAKKNGTAAQEIAYGLQRAQAPESTAVGVPVSWDSYGASGRTEEVPLTGDKNHYLQTSQAIQRMLQETRQGPYVEQLFGKMRQTMGKRNGTQTYNDLKQQMRREYGVYIEDHALDDWLRYHM